MENWIKGVQRVLERVDSIRLVLLEQQLQQEYDQILFQEELQWFQKSREQWVQLGDRNTKFFHAQTKARRTRSKIHGLTLPCGAWCTDESILQEEALKFFKNLFCLPNAAPIAALPIRNIPKLSSEMAESLSQSVSKEKVTAVLNDMRPYKAPGPNGFQGIFFRHYCHLIGYDIWHLVKEAFATGYFQSELAETLIASISKVECPANFKEFRPISLCNTIYKLITKVLVNKLRPMLNSIINPLQSRFLPKRGTIDNAIILQEIVHVMHKSKSKKGDVIYKIDLEKAYDNVKWDFLEGCLIDFGFLPTIQ